VALSKNYSTALDTDLLSAIACFKAWEGISSVLLTSSGEMETRW